MRLDKYLAECNIGTRSEVKKHIKNKLVTVNEIVAQKPEMKIDENTDVICFKGKQILYEKYVYYLFHKPAGCVTAKTDNLHKTVMEYLGEEVKSDVSPVGRLDLDTEGLLIMTNDGPLLHHLLSPAHHIPKTYYAEVDAVIPQEAVALFEKGVDIGDDKPTLPAALEILSETSANLTITEGRFHQVKRMFAAVGCNVTYLKRIKMGQLSLSDLPIGAYRRLTEEEILSLKNDNN